MKKYFTFSFLYLCASLFLVSATVGGAESNPALQRVIPNISATEFTLSNGIKVCLKPTDYEEDEISIRLIAKGGFSLVDPKDRASAELSSQVALESGFSNLTSDKLSVLLYEKSADFSIQIGAFSRSIEAACSSDGLETVFKLMNACFTKREFFEDKYQDVVNRARTCIKKRNLDFDVTYEDVYRAVNTGNFVALRPLLESDLNRADFTASKKFMDYAFSNPEDFICVVVGDFKEEEVKSLLEKYLATIVSKKSNLNLSNLKGPAFPKGVTLREICCSRVGESLVRLTFPIQAKIDEKSVFAVELACQLIEERLREKIKADFQTTQAIDVAYEFPVYPSLEFSWISIQFRSDAKSIDQIAKLILKELKYLQNLGPSLFDLENAKIQQRQSDEYWLRQNDFWLASLSNYYLVGWDPGNIVQGAKKDKKLSVEKIRDVIKNYISLAHYSIIWSTP